ncbi:MAG: DUF5329 family protein [Pseudomonadota bacterium]
MNWKTLTSGRGRRSLAVAWLVLLLPITANASVDASIDTLLTTVATSQCEFERNGKRYSGERARSHLQRKRNYLGDRIRTVEDFITMAATGSSRSGKPYWIICNGERTPSAEWLRVRYAAMEVNPATSAGSTAER